MPKPAMELRWAIQEHWSTIFETMRLDARSNMFDRALRDRIGQAIERIVDTPSESRGDFIVKSATKEVWDLVVETLSMDARSAAFDDALRARIEEALNELLSEADIATCDIRPSTRPGM